MNIEETKPIESPEVIRLRTLQSRLYNEIANLTRQAKTAYDVYAKVNTALISIKTEYHEINYQLSEQLLQKKAKNNKAKKKGEVKKSNSPALSLSKIQALLEVLSPENKIILLKKLNLI